MRWQHRGRGDEQALLLCLDSRQKIHQPNPKHLTGLRPKKLHHLIGTLLLYLNINKHQSKMVTAELMAGDSKFL